MSKASYQAASGAQGGIDPGTSSYLDLMRPVAATVVVLSHLIPNLFGVDVIPGHDAVIVFFVISGYVIAYAAAERDRTLERFVVNRLSRLWSVLLPSLLVSLAAAVLVGATSDVMYAPPIAQPAEFIAASLQNALFLGQNWFLAKPVPFSDPAWSLCYEAWYYAIFAAFIFSPPRRRWLAAGMAVVLAGPPIVALMPGWLLGVWLYRARARLTLPARVAYALFAACILLYALCYWIDLGPRSRLWLSELTGNHSYRLRASTRFGSDFLNACLFTGTIIAVGSMPAVNRWLATIRPFSRAAASRTFSLYLYHMPVFVILYAGLRIGRGSTVEAVLCIGLVMAVCIVLGGFTEARLGWWRQAVQGMFDGVRTAAAAVSAGPFAVQRRAGSSPR